MESTPDVERIDQWLFLAQHVRLPTRLLDWTEGLLIALYFALECENPVIWMLNPDRLNSLSVEGGEDSTPNAFPLTWLYHPETKTDKTDIINILDNRTRMTGSYLKKLTEKYINLNIGATNIKRAWGSRDLGTKYPVAILPTYIHPRMYSQKSCFTIQGLDDRIPLTELVGEDILMKYVIANDKKDRIIKELRMLGVTKTSLFPEIDSLADELKNLF